MEIEISSKTGKIIEEASKKLNLDRETAIIVALKSYLKIYEDPELKEELEAWERASDEDLAKFNRQHGF